MKLTEARILVVDDEPELVKIYAAWFAAFGCSNISVAHDGDEALEMCKDQAFDLLISDINMPRMDGITMLSNLRQRSQTSPCIIFVSGYNAANKARMEELGVHSALSKPVRRKDLLAAATTALENYEPPQK